MTASPDPTYPPLDTPKALAPGVWIVDSGPLRVAGLLPVPVRMIVIRLRSGDLLLHSPTRHTPELQRALEQEGPVRHIVAPNSAHWMFVDAWQKACQGATTWAAPGLRQRGAVQKSGVRLDRELGEAPPPVWAGEIAHVMVPGGAGFREVCLLHEPTRTLVLTDLVLNLEPEKLPPLMRPLARLVGATAPDGRAPVYLRLVVKAGGEPAREAARRLLAFAPERVLFSHGRPFTDDAPAALRRSLRWLTG